MFVDKAEIVVEAGTGGAGIVSFHREKYKPFGGPDGGDGGKGGDVYIVADGGIEDLSFFLNKKYFKADDGGAGGSNKMHGANAEDLILKVPVGTNVYLKNENENFLIADLYKDGQIVKVAVGGRGGKGNVYFATATRKAPKYSQPGTAGEKTTLTLKLKLPVDVAIIGPPNSGKSSLLSAVSGARPLIADYPFTTRQPVLGVVDNGKERYTWGEIPAISVELRAGREERNRQLVHAERALVLLYLFDINSGTIENDMIRLKKKVEYYSTEMVKKPSLIVLNKADLVEDKSVIDNLTMRLHSHNTAVHIISAKEKTGIDKLVEAAHRLAHAQKEIKQEEFRPEIIFRPRPIS